MDNLLEKTKQAVDKFHSKQAGDKVKATKAILASVQACRSFITDAGQELEGATQQLAKQLSELLIPLPAFRSYASDKSAIEAIESKDQANEHLDKIERDLEASLKDLQVGRKKKIQDWVKSHPVLGKLKKSTASKELPQGAYVLLFRRSANMPPKKQKGAGKRHGEMQQAAESKIAVMTILETAEREASLLTKEELTAPVAEIAGEFENNVAAAVEETENLSHGTADQAIAEEQNTEENSMLEETNSEFPDEIDSEASDDDLSDLEDVDDDELGAEPGDSEEGMSVLAGVEPVSETETDDNADSVSLESQEHEAVSGDAKTEEQSFGQEAIRNAAPSSSEDSSKNQGSDEKLPRVNNGPQKPSGAERIPPDLVVRPTPEGKVFTRFRPKEFSDDSRIYRMFRGGPPLVGACIIADGKLLASIGVLPQPDEGRDQLRHLLSISKDAVGKPGRDFVESNPILSELFSLCKGRKIHKDAYILLFQYHEEEQPEEKPAERPQKGKKEKEKPQDKEGKKEELQSAEEQPASSDNPLEESKTDESVANSEDNATPAQDIEAAAADADLTTDADGSVEESEAAPVTSVIEESGNGSDAAALTEESSAPPVIELVSKTTEDGRIITRYRSFDFSDMRGIFETFKKRPKVAGAAIIRERELIKIIGEVPSKEGTKQLDVLLNVSRQALEKPAMEFIAGNQVLNNLFELSNGDYRQKEYDVVLFTDEDGRLVILPLADRRGKMQPKTPLAEFRIPKFLHDRFKTERPIAGASIIGEPSAQAAPQRAEARAGKDNRGGGSRQDSRDVRPRSQPSRSPIVMAAFGRTPLKQNVLLSSEILKRLGVDLSIL